MVYKINENIPKETKLASAIENTDGWTDRQTDSE